MAVEVEGEEAGEAGGAGEEGERAEERYGWLDVSAQNKVRRR